jgi:hypothetical protein
MEVDTWCSLAVLALAEVLRALPLGGDTVRGVPRSELSR